MAVRHMKSKFGRFLQSSTCTFRFLLLLLLVFIGVAVIFTPRKYYSSVIQFQRETNQPHLNNFNQHQINNNEVAEEDDETQKFQFLLTNSQMPAKESYNLTAPGQDAQNKLKEASYPNLPAVPYILGSSGKDGAPQNFNSTCAKFPTLYEIKFSNTYWQTLEASKWTLEAMGAYLDTRDMNPDSPTIRIVGMINRIGPNITSYCQIWFENEAKPQIAQVGAYDYIWFSKWGNYKDGEWQPYLISCNLPKSHASKVPTSVSIVETPCSHSTINLKVIYDKPQGEKEGFAVCVKGMDFPDDDLSIRLIEWVELQYILGAGKIFLYELANSPETRKVMDYYAKIGKIEIIPTTLPAGLPNDPHIRHAFLKKKIAVKRQTELLPYNDCFYRHMYQYNYIAIVDVDEIIMPKKHANWHELATELEKTSLKTHKTGSTSFVFHNVYFFHNPADQDEAHFEDIPKEYTMLQHVRRTKYNYTKKGYQIKCFHNTEKILTLHNHFPRSCLGGCKSFHVEKDIAQMQHYKPTCFSQKKCVEEFKENSVLDTSIWKYKDELIKRVNDVVGILQMKVS